MNYQNTKIYKIESDLGDKIYVGSTAKEYLSQRFQQHKHSYKQWKAGKTNKTMSYDLFDEYGVEICRIVLIEAYPCECKDAKNAREGHYIKELTCVNKIKIGNGQTHEEILQAMKDLYERNKELVSESKKKYYIEKRESILIKRKDDYQKKKAQQVIEVSII